MMNNLKQFFLGLSAAILCSAGLISTANAGLAGRVQFVSGNVQLLNAAGAGRTIKKGDDINEGDSLVSAADANAQIRMQDGGMVALRPDTHLKFDQFVFNGKQDGSEKSFFSLLRGGFRAITGLVGQTNKQNYRINTPVATVGIRGTDHETVLILPNTPMALLAPSGAYSKVNVGETTLTTNLGTINVTPNQMGFAGALNQAPQVQAINTKLFTVAAAPVSKAKDEKKAPTQSDKVASTETTAAASTEPTAEVRSVAVVDAVAPNAAVMVSSNASASVEKAPTRFAAALTTPGIPKVDDVKKLTDVSGKKINLTNQTITSSDGSVVAITTVTAASTSTTTVAPTTSTSTAVTTSTSTAATSTTTVAPTTSTSTAVTTSTSIAATSTTTVAPTTSTSTAVTTSTTTASTPTTTLVVQAYLQSDISYEVSAGQNGGYGNHGMGPSTALTPLSNPTTFQSGQSCSDCGSYSFQLNGASGPVNGQATSFATTGIEFGRWTSVTSVTNTSTYPFGSGSSYSGGRSAWAFGPQGYLDSLITLSSATGGTSTGVFNYVLTGSAPAPSDQNGTAGTLNSLSLAANFSTQTVTAALSASLGSSTWNATSNAMSIGSYNGTGFNGSLTVTGGSAAVAYSGSLNGAFTGQNYAGAVVGYAIQETSSTAGSPTSFSGVAALTRNGVSGNAIVNNGVAAPTGQFVVAQGGGYAGYVQTSSSTTVTGGVLTGFDYSYNATAGANTNNTSITCTTCTGQAVPDTTTGIQMGSWDTGTRTDVFTSPVNGQFHWIKGPGLNPIYLPEVLLGSMNYTLDGGSAPTNQAGVTGSLNSASLTVNFTTQTVDLTLGVTANGHTWTASSTGLPLDWTNYSKNGFSTNYYDGNAAGNALTVTLDGAPVTTGYSSLSGQLTGSGLNGALFQYELNASQWLPSVPGNLVASDGVAVQAPSVTVTNSTTGGSANVTFPVGTSGTVVVQPATTLTLGLNAAGAPTSASLTGGVSATVTTLIADTTKPGSYNGLASTGESVALDTYAATSAARYSNFGEWRILPTVTSVGTGPFSNGAFAGGMLLTPSASMPTNNVVVTGTYSGLMVGSAQDSVNNTPYSLTAGAVVLSANFSTGALTGTISNILAYNRATGGLAGYFNDLDLTATIGANAFTGSVTAQAGPGTSTCGTFCPPPTVGGAIPSPVNLPVGATGSSGGHFYGPNANELTGVWQLTNGTIKAAGAFGANNGTSFIGISESVNGTVALVATTPADTATVYRVVAFSTFDSSMVNGSFGGLRTDGSYNSNAHVSADTAGNLTGFDAWLDVSSGSNSTSMKQAVALGKGTSVAADLGTDAVTGISWGRWAGGNIAMTDRATGVSATASNASSLHWLAGPIMTAPVNLPTTGTYSYVLAGGTAPTDNLGNTGTLNSASLTANFTTQTVNIGVDVGITNATGAANYVASANNVAIEQRSGFSAKTGVAAGSPSALTATCNGAGCGPVAAVQARIGGAFTGSTGQGAGMIYGFANGSNVVSGVAAFKR